MAGYRLEERGCSDREPIIEPPGDADEDHPLGPQARDQLRRASRSRHKPEATQLHGRVGRGNRRQARRQEAALGLGGNEDQVSGHEGVSIGL